MAVNEVIFSALAVVPVCVVQDSGFYYVAAVTAVTHARIFGGFHVDVGNLFSGLWADGKTAPFGFYLGYFIQFVRCIILEGNLEGNTGSKSRVFVEELVHFVRIACEYHDGTVPAIFHLLDDGGYGFITESAVIIICESVCFIDEEELPLCPVKYGFNQDGRLAGIVIAQWAEGINRVLMLPAEGIVEAPRRIIRRSLCVHLSVIRSRSCRMLAAYS